MEWHEVKGNWKQLKGQVRERWAELTDDELEQAHASRDQMEGLLQARYGLTHERAQQQVDEFLRTLDMERQPW